MRTRYGLTIVVVAVATLFLIYPHLGLVYIFCGFICAAIVVFYTVPKTENDRERREPLWPSSHRGTDVSAAWLGAKLDEEEEMRRKAENNPR